MLLAEVINVPGNLPGIQEILLYPLLLFFVYREIRKRDTLEKTFIDQMKANARIESELRSKENRIETLEKHDDDYEQRLRHLEQKN